MSSFEELEGTLNEKFSPFPRFALEVVFLLFYFLNINLNQYYSTHTLFHNIFTSRTPESTSSVSMGGQG